METTSYKPSIYAVGVKRRCRKNEGHVFHLESIPFKNYDANDLEAIKIQAMAKVEENMKSFSKVNLTLYKETHKGCVTMWSPFDEGNIKVSIV